MRIALLCQSYPPMVSGITMAARHMAEGLAARGHAAPDPHPEAGGAPP